MRFINQRLLGGSHSGTGDFCNPRPDSQGPASSRKGSPAWVTGKKAQQVTTLRKPASKSPCLRCLYWMGRLGIIFAANQRAAAAAPPRARPRPAETPVWEVRGRAAWGVPGLSYFYSFCDLSRDDTFCPSSLWVTLKAKYDFIHLGSFPYWHQLC